VPGAQFVGNIPPMSRRPICTVILLTLLLTTASCIPITGALEEAPGNATVVWISIDGLRHDYIDRIHPPTLERLKREGAFTNQEIPVFPSLTFPNHAAQVTGQRVDGTGVPANLFYDPVVKQQFWLPDDQWVMRAEPIWVAAKREGVRSAVINWPMSHNQTGPYTSDYFGQKYDMKETDEQRLSRIVTLLNADKAAPTLRLVMTYLSHVDVTGHSFGPDSPEVDQAVRAVDASLGKFVTAVTTWFDATHSKDDELYILITTDHGMEAVRTPVNLDRLIGGALTKGAKLVPSGSIATVHLLDLPPEDRDERARQIVAKLKSNAFLQAWPSKEVPAKYHYSDLTRLGDVVVLLSPGYTFTTLRAGATQPTTTLKGNHGYDPAVSPNMLGSAVIWQYRRPLPKQGDLGPIENTQWAATVSELLRIAPPPKSDPHVVKGLR